MTIHTVNFSYNWFLALHKIDEFTKEPFKLGDRIVVCNNCNKVHLESSWNILGGRCIQCKQTETKLIFSPDDFKNKINIVSSNLTRISERNTSTNSGVEREAREQREREERERMDRKQEQEAREQRKKWFKIITVVAVVIFVIIIWPKGNKVPTTDPPSPIAEAVQATSYSYVTSYGLNVRSGSSPRNSIIREIGRGTRVQLVEGTGNISGSWRKIKIGNYEGWVDSSYLQTITITELAVGNSNKNGDWITQSGVTLNARDIRFLKPVITYNASTNEDLTFYVKIIDQDGNLDRNSDSPAGYTYSTRGNIRGGTGNFFILHGWGSEGGGIYSPGEYTIEVWYDGVCLCSKKVRLN
jgi:hypothetical protein